MANIIINQSVAILIDGNNIERSIHDETKTTNAMINFDSLIPRLLNGRGLNRLIYFREGRSISTKLAERLYTQFYGSVVPCHKTADIPLSIKATQLASKVDTIIIMSGDSDFIDLAKHLKAEGVRVEIAAIKKTTSKYLIDEVDYFHEVTKDDWFTYSGGKHYSGNKHRSQGGNQQIKKPVATAPPSLPPPFLKPFVPAPILVPVVKPEVKLEFKPGFKPLVKPLEKQVEKKPESKPSPKKPAKKKPSKKQEQVVPRGAAKK
ncbi:NYN domain-containing protein [Candidatus Woesearchaeota archaeon]|nr:NYN domain-containing protein [Candidatus Woesearchaeota archaeon]